MPLLIRPQMDLVNSSQPSETRNSANFNLLYSLLIQSLFHHLSYGCYGTPCIAVLWKVKDCRSSPKE